MGMLSNKGAQYLGGIAGVANGWSTNTNFTTYNDTQNALGRTTRNRSILTSGIENKFELKTNTQGQSIGGPERKTNITMWDLMTLYDTKKKRIEDEAAFRSHKQQQSELMSFYDSQMDFKHEKRKHEQHLKDNDLKHIRNLH